MAKAIFNKDLCKGCGLCIDVCPKKIVALQTKQVNNKGHHPADCIDQAQCIGCAFCARMCPDCVIKIEK